MALVNFFTGERRLVNKVISCNPVSRVHPIVTSVTYWHPDEKTIKVVEVGPDWFCDGVDLSGEFLVQFNEYMKERRKLKIDIKENEHQIVRFGDTLRVIKGRKVPLMTHGDLYWAKRGQFGMTIGVRDDRNKVWFTSARNVQMYKNKVWTRPFYILMRDGSCDIFD